MKKSKDSLQKLWGTIKQTIICTIEVPDVEEREKVSESLFKEIMAKISPNLGKETDIQIQEA